MTKEFIEKRSHQRKSDSSPLKCYFFGNPKQDIYSCQASDISDTGIGILAETPLRRGQVIIIKEENPFSIKTAIVQWSRKTDNRYRAGLIFI